MTSRLRTLLGCAALLLASAFGTAGVASAQSITLVGCQSLTGPVIQGGNITITCNTGGGGPTPPSCSLPSLTTVGTTLTFASTCTQGTNPITAVTAAGAAQTPVNPTHLYTVAGIPIPTVTTTYTITASDGTLTGSNNVVYSPTGGGGGAIDLTNCTNGSIPGIGSAAGYDSVYPTPLTGNINIANIYATASGGAPFANSTALVIRFRTGSTLNDTSQPNFQPWQLPGSNINHQATLGTAPCLAPTFNSTTAPVIKTVIGQTPGFNMQVVSGGTCPTPGQGSCLSTVWLAPNTDYFITLINKGPTFTSPVGGCNGACDMRFNFNN